MQLKRLQAIAAKGSRVVLGLMSGTSHDGVDAAIARVTGSGGDCRAELVSHSHVPYPDALRKKVAESFDGPTALVCALNFELGEFFAAAALEAIKKAGLRPADVDLIGSHGQTIYHVPPEGGRGGHPGSTLQIGEGAVIAARTGIVTISDMRTADVAAGGHGAPLTPLADWLLFRRPGETLAVLNIGGIASVSVVTQDLGGVYGFDAGPGNSLIDETVRITSGGKRGYDKDGELARSGKLIPDLLKNLISMPYFSLKPPRTTGRELFGKKMAEDILSSRPEARKEDIIRTLTQFTAECVRAAFESFIFPKAKPGTVVLTGGGAKNGLLVELIRGLFPDAGVVFADDLGVPAQAREALCFALLANETISGNPGNVPAATGAARGTLLGKISL